MFCDQRCPFSKLWLIWNFPAIYSFPLSKILKKLNDYFLMLFFEWQDKSSPFTLQVNTITVLFKADKSMAVSLFLFLDIVTTQFDFKVILASLVNSIIIFFALGLTVLLIYRSGYCIFWSSYFLLLSVFCQFNSVLFFLLLGLTDRKSNVGVSREKLQ